MILKRELAEGQHELIAPVVEVTGVDVEDDGDEIPDVGDSDWLGIQGKKCNRLVKEHGRVEVGGGRQSDTGGFQVSRGGGRVLLDGTRQSLAGALGSGVALLGGGRGFHLNLERARQSGIAALGDEDRKSVV